MAGWQKLATFHATQKNLKAFAELTFVNFCKKNAKFVIFCKSMESTALPQLLPPCNMVKCV